MGRFSSFVVLTCGKEALCCPERHLRSGIMSTPCYCFLAPLEHGVITKNFKKTIVIVSMTSDTTKAADRETLTKTEF